VAAVPLGDFTEAEVSGVGYPPAIHPFFGSLPILLMINAAAPKELTGKWLFPRIFSFSCPLVPLISNQLADTYSSFIFFLKNYLLPSGSPL